MEMLIWLGAVIGYLLIGTFIFSIINSASAGEIDSIWIMLLWPLFIVAGILTGIILGVINAGEFIGNIIFNKLN